MNNQAFWRAVLPLVALSVGAGAASAASEKKIFQETVEKTYPVQSTAKFRLKNEDGSVWIYGADVSEMKVRAVKKAYRKDRLAAINVNVVVGPDEIRIDTGFPPKSKWGLADRSGTVDYLVILPWYCDMEKVELGAGELSIEGMRGKSVQAELGSGRMFARNCFTDLHLSLASGGLEVAYDWWESHTVAVDARIASGNTWMLIPAGAQFRLQAQSKSGQVVTNFPNDRRPGNTGRLELAVGDQPNAEMNIQAVNGNVVIREINR